jgi:DNA-binding response OmpR family regulator
MFINGPWREVDDRPFAGGSDSAPAGALSTAERSLALNLLPVLGSLRRGRVGKRIVVIDEDPDFLALVDEMLTRAGYDVHTFGRRADLVESVRALAPSAVLLDLHLGGARAGWLVFVEMRRDGALMRTPVIMCSDDARELYLHADALRTLEAYALEKPFDPEKIAGMLQELIGGPQKGWRSPLQTGRRRPARESPS